MTVSKAIFGLAALAAMTAPTALTAQDRDQSSALIAEALAEARRAQPNIEVQALTCAENQRQIAISDGVTILYPCGLRDVVEDSFDATMLVTLLLAEPAAIIPTFDKGVPLPEAVAAIGAAALGAGLDPETGVEKIQRNASAHTGEPSPPLSAYLARDSKAFKQEVARAESEESLRRTSERSEERRRERAAEERAEEQAQEARYRSVTDFLNLAHAQGFCPADGRAFLKRATAYSTSPLQNDRPMGLWADDRRHALEPYLNDMTRCR
ncbi:hypothetical protein [Qipengyuania gaetbuli]|uniref:hypothetical protein n=1 Tax=Qipengyuania gaetbuli TaxID=266952 RepID=UPI001CFF53A8|nr:hypothetical protein [Qipengyuania gaetbuli]